MTPQTPDIYIGVGTQGSTMNAADAIEFTDEDIFLHRNKFGPVDGRMLPRQRRNEDVRSGKCQKCGEDCGPYMTCSKHREIGSLFRALKNLESEGRVVRVSDGRGSRGGSKWRLKPKTPYVRSDEKIGRNDICPCGSGKKHKFCCLSLSQKVTT